jgi:hypothetical protein
MGLFVERPEKDFEIFGVIMVIISTCLLAINVDSVGEYLQKWLVYPALILMQRY